MSKAGSRGRPGSTGTRGCHCFGHHPGSCLSQARSSLPRPSAPPPRSPTPSLAVPEAVNHPDTPPGPDPRSHLPVGLWPPTLHPVPLVSSRGVFPGLSPAVQCAQPPPVAQIKLWSPAPSPHSPAGAALIQPLTAPRHAPPRCHLEIPGVSGGSWGQGSWAKRQLQAALHRPWGDCGSVASLLRGSGRCPLSLTRVCPREVCRGPGPGPVAPLLVLSPRTA